MYASSVAQLGQWQQERERAVWMAVKQATKRMGELRNEAASQQREMVYWEQEFARVAANVEKTRDPNAVVQGEAYLEQINGILTTIHHRLYALDEELAYLEQTETRTRGEQAMTAQVQTAQATSRYQAREAKERETAHARRALVRQLRQRR